MEGDEVAMTKPAPSAKTGKVKLTKAQREFLERARSGTYGGEWVGIFSFGGLRKPGRGASVHLTLDALVRRGLLEADSKEPVYRITPLGRRALKESSK